MPFNSNKIRDYHDKDKLIKLLSKYPEDKYPKFNYAQLLRDMQLERSETASLIHYLNKFGLNRGVKISQKKYETDEERRQARIESVKKYLASKEDETTLLLANFPKSVKDKIKDLKGKKSYTQFFIDVTKEKYTTEFLEV